MRYRTNESQRGQPDKTAQGLAKFLGVFSIVLGLGELLLHNWLSAKLGLQGYDWIIPTYGVREILTGALILAVKDPTPWIWLRVIGDVLDIATVAFGYSRHLADNINFVVTFIILAGATAIDLYCALRLSRDSKEPLPPTKDYSDRSGLPGAA